MKPPVMPFDRAMVLARKKPPRPPAKPTRPVITPTSLRKRCGSSWNTAPLPMPRHSVPIENRATAIQPMRGSSLSAQPGAPEGAGPSGSCDTAK